MNPISTAKNAVESLLNNEERPTVTNGGVEPKTQGQHLLALWDKLDSRSVSRIDTAVENGRTIILDGCINGSRVAMEYDPEEEAWYPEFDRGAADGVDGSYSLTIRV